MNHRRGEDILREVRIRYPYAKRVVDAKEPLPFRMDRKHIAGCRRNDASHCPVHKRLNNVLKEPTIVLHSVAYVVKSTGDVVRYVFDQPLRDAIRHYDAGGKFSPGAFSLRPPCKSQRIRHAAPVLSGMPKAEHRERLKRAVRRNVDQ